jgi:hypothetical protein
MTDSLSVAAPVSAPGRAVRWRVAVHPSLVGGRAMHPVREPPDDGIEVLPVTLVTKTFQARPSSIPDIRDFVRVHLANARLSADDVRSLGQRATDVLLDAAGTGGGMQVILRIFADHAEVDVLQTGDGEAITMPGAEAPGTTVAPVAAADHRAAVPLTPDAPTSADGAVAGTAATIEPSFATWLGAALRRDGMTMEAAARELKVSVKTVSRWVSGTTEPRLRDLSRIRQVFGDLPFP